MNEPTWLPQELEPVVARLARVDDLIYELGDVAGSWSPTALTLRQSKRADGRFRVSVSSVRPVPPIAPLLFSEAVNHLRAVLDNAVWHLVATHSEPLDERAAKKVALPIYGDSASFAAWTKQVRKSVPVLGGEDGPVRERVEQLQPFCDSSRIPSVGPARAAALDIEPENVHPLQLLQAYSNADKHRSIRMMAARATMINLDEPDISQDRAMREVPVGMVIAEGTWGERVPLESSAALVIARPDPWHAHVSPTAEIDRLRAWVLSTALPVLVTGSTSASPPLPEAMSLDDDGRTLRDRIRDPQRDPAYTRLSLLHARRLAEAYSAPWNFPDVVDEEFTD